MSGSGRIAPSAAVAVVGHGEVPTAACVRRSASKATEGLRLIRGEVRARDKPGTPVV